MNPVNEPTRVELAEINRREVYAFLESVDLSDLGIMVPRDERNRIDSDWTCCIKAEELLKRLNQGLLNGTASGGPLRRQMGFDGEASFIFEKDEKGKGKEVRGRFHFALCFDGQYYAITFRSLKDVT